MTLKTNKNNNNKKKQQQQQNMLVSFETNFGLRLILVRSLIKMGKKSSNDDTKVEIELLFGKKFWYCHIPKADVS